MTEIQQYLGMLKQLKDFDDLSRAREDKTDKVLMMQF